MIEKFRKPKNGQTMHLILIVLFLFLSVCLIVKGCTSTTQDPDIGSNILPQDPIINDPILQPNVPHVVSTARVGITGSLYIQDPVIESTKTESGQYDFSQIFATVSQSYQSYDYMIAHLETTLGGTSAGEFSGDKKFNTPDSLIPALKEAGIDMLLTSNNHCYDTGHEGFIRTQEILNENKMAYTGTRLNTATANYTIQEINGVKLGMICYTHETGDTAEGNKTIRDIVVDSEDTDLINSFNYRQMEQFYEEVKAAMEAMDSAGADYTLFFIHWGNEFDLVPSGTQKKVAQNLCEIGVDFIIGSHPHIVQPMELLTSESGSSTYCLYSAGNALSSQRRRNTVAANATNGHTEDGVILSIKFEKWDDGSVKIADLNATPLWVDAAASGENTAYSIIPVDVTYNFYPALTSFANKVNNVVDPQRDPFAQISYAPSDPTQIGASYNRTMDTVLDGLNECRQALGLQPVSNTPGT